MKAPRKPSELDSAVAHSMSQALGLVPQGSVLRLEYRAEGAPAPATYVGELAGFDVDERRQPSFTLRTPAGHRRFLAVAGRLFGIEVLRLGTER